MTEIDLRINIVGQTSSGSVVAQSTITADTSVGGLPGRGIPTGGTTAQALIKTDATNYNTEWETIDKTFVGLGSADNTADVDKPVSTATAAYVDGNQAMGNLPVKLANLTHRNIYSINSGTGDIDLYTVPAGKQALIASFSAYNSTGGSITFTPKMYTSGAYYPTGVAVAVATVTASAVNGSRFRHILNAGEKFAITTTGTGLSVFALIQEWDANTGAKRADFLSLSVGDNTLLTVPTGKRIICLPTNSIQAPFTGNGTADYFNNSGGSRTIKWYLVPSGESIGATTQYTASTSVATASTNAMAGASGLNAGDSIVINVDAATATQSAYVSYLEYDV